MGERARASMPAVGAAMVGAQVRELAAAAARSLLDAAVATRPEEAYAAAHLAALRTAAALLAADPVPTGRGGPRSAWELLATRVPELAEWAAFFAAGAGKRAAAQAGVRGAVTRRDADDLVRDAQAFLDLATTRLGLPSRSQGLPLVLAG